MPSVTEVFGVLLAVMMVFAILSLQLFSDSFGSCSDDSYTTRESCLAAAEAGRRLELSAGARGPWLPPDSLGLARLDVGSRRALKGGHDSNIGETDFATSDSTMAPWLNPAFGSFDSFGSAMLLLYVMSTGDGWEDVMYQGMDAVGPGIAPVRNDFSPSAMFFIAWMFFGAFFALNLFVGTICDNFSRIKAETDGSATLTAGQAQWVESLKVRKNAKPFRMARPPNNKGRALLFDFVMSRQFELAIMGVIVANVLLMATDHWSPSEGFATVYTHGMTVFSYIYYCEATLKIAALGLNYFRDNWCRFDFFLVCTTLLDQFGHELLETILPLPPMLLRVLRVLRILRVLRLLKSKRAKGLRDLMMTLVLSAPALVNISSLLALLMGMYAVLGVQLFTCVTRSEPPSPCTPPRVALHPLTPPHTLTHLLTPHTPPHTPPHITFSHHLTPRRNPLAGTWPTATRSSPTTATLTTSAARCCSSSRCSPATTGRRSCPTAGHLPRARAARSRRATAAPRRPSHTSSPSRCSARL